MRATYTSTRENWSTRKARVKPENASRVSRVCMYFARSSKTTDDVKTSALCFEQDHMRLR